MPAYASCVGQQFPALGIPVLELTPTLRAGLTCRFEESHCFCLRETARDLQTEDVYVCGCTVHPHIPLRVRNFRAINSL